MTRSNKPGAKSRSEMPSNLNPPSGYAQLAELALPFDLIRYGLRGYELFGAPRGDGRPIILLPGYRASELSLRPLEAWLRHLGYHVSDWGLGRNEGHVAKDVERFVSHARFVSEENGGAPLTLIGWSLGGIIARETARLFPKLVREIITMGTPLIGGPKYTSIGPRVSSRRNLDLDRYEKAIHAHNSEGLTQPLTVLYSERDGVVGPDAAIDIYNPHARNIKVDGGHLSLGINPRVWRIIANTLGAEKDSDTAWSS